MAVQLARQDQLIVDDGTMLFQVGHSHPSAFPDGLLAIVWQLEIGKTVISNANILDFHGRLLSWSFSYAAVPCIATFPSATDEPVYAM